MILMATFSTKNEATSAKPLCNDGADNDGDGLIDAQDPGYENSADEDERDPSVPNECADGRDNDLDGLPITPRSWLRLFWR